MKKIFSFSEFLNPRKVNESTMGQMSLKREEFDVIVDPQGGKEGGQGGGGTDVGQIEIITGVTEGPGEKPLPKASDPKKTPGKIQDFRGDKPEDKDGGEIPPPSLPSVGDRVILSDGREATIKRVLPNGDIEV